MAIIELSGVSLRMGGHDILRDICFRLDERRVAIIGANGSGKSTLARLFNALVLPSTGVVQIGGIDTRSDGKHARRMVGLVFQNPEHQIVMPTVEEDIAFGLRNIGKSKPETDALVTAVLAEHGLGDKRECAAHLLSGGEKKLLSILSVLVMEPQVIVFDEPLASLDHVNRRRILALIDSLPQRVITITHDLDTLEGYDRALLLHEGRLVADGAPVQVRARYLELIGECLPPTSQAAPRFTALQPG
jgi:biotin transport system ATP-binding protein